MVVVPTWVALSWLVAIFIMVAMRMDWAEQAVERGANRGAWTNPGDSIVQKRRGGALSVELQGTKAPQLRNEIQPKSIVVPSGADRATGTAQKFGFYLHVYNQPAAVIHQAFQM